MISPLASFDRPEYRLAFRISFAVLFALLSVITAVTVMGAFVDDDRIDEFFARKEAMLSSRRGGVLQTLSAAPREQLDSRLRERRFLPEGLRNVVVVFPDGSFSALGAFDAPEISVADLRIPPDRKTVRREFGGEEFLLYAFPIGEGRSIVFYEPEEILAGPRMAIFLSLVTGILAFSVALFFISLSFARKVIRPIEELADRERAYARHIAHELKTPLAVAKSDLQLALVEKGESEERIRSAVSEIGAMRDTVDDLLLFSSSGSLARTEPSNLVEILSDVLKKTGASARFDVVRDADAPETVPADAKLVSTLFRNLVSNAAVHAPSDARISVRFFRNGFSFSNPAPDADPKIIRKAFDAFVGTPGKGSGIGLSLVKRIAVAHGWTAAMEFRDGTVTASVKYSDAG